MASYTWNGTPDTFSDWNTPANWIGGVAPDAPDANVVFPVITDLAGNPVGYFVTIGAGETISAVAVALASYLNINGVLDVTGAVTYTGGEIDMGGGTLALGSLDDANGYDIQGSGTIVSAGSIVNAGRIIGSAGLVLSVASFDNTGTILATGGTVSLDVAGAGGFVNVARGTLTGGWFGAQTGGDLVLPVPGGIVVDASTISLAATTSSVSQVGPAGTTQLQSTLATIAPSGVLAVSGAYTTANTLEDDGTLTLTTATLTAAGLLIGSHGVVSGDGTIAAPLSGTGTIVATGIATPLIVPSLNGVSAQISRGTLEIEGAAASAVAFEDTDASVRGLLPQQAGSASSTLMLDNPALFAGAISDFNTLYYVFQGIGSALMTVPDTVVLAGLSLSSVVGDTYAGDTQGGILSIQLASGSVALRFLGDYSISDFLLSAGAQAYSNSPPSLAITDPIIHLTGTAPSIATSVDEAGHWIEGAQSNASIALGGGNQTIVLTGSGERISAVGLRPYNDLILGPAGTSTIMLGDGDQTVVAFGASNTISVGNAGTAPGAAGSLSYINAGAGQETVTAGDGTNVINTGGYGDTIATGNGLNLIFATDLGTVTAAATLGPAGHTTLSLGTGNNFAYLHGASNRIMEGGGTDAIWGGTGGGDSFSLAATGGVLFVENFGNGDVLDLTRLLAGAPLASDLSNIASFMSVVATGPDDAVFGVNDGGTKTVLQVLGTGGTAYVNLENVGSLSVAGLIGQGALGLPPQ